MSASGQLYKLAERAQRSEQNIDAAKAKGEAELREQVQRARDASEHRAAALKTDATSAQAGASSWWGEVQDNWRTHLAKARQGIDDTKADHEVHAAERRADSAERDAEAAVDFAYAALEEAEYAVLDAQLARMQADVTAAAR